MRGGFLAVMVGFTSADVCTNTCKYAFDRVCDDGGPGSTFSLCPLGTDCSDCGRNPQPPSAPQLRRPPPLPRPPLDRNPYWPVLALSPPLPRPPTLVCPAIIAAAQTQHLLFSIPLIVLLLVPFLSSALCPNPLYERGCGGRGQHGVLALIFAVILPVCYSLNLAFFPYCDGIKDGNLFCPDCFGLWYLLVWIVFTNITVGGMVASIYIAYLCLRGSKPVPRAVWAIWVWLFMPLFFLIGHKAFGPTKNRWEKLCRAHAQDSSNELSIGSLSETATSSLMSNQATPEVHFVPNNTPVHVPVVLTPMAPNLAPNVPVAPNLAPNVPMAVHVPMAPALVQTFPKAVHVTMAQHDHMAPTVPVAPNGPETVSCTVSPLQCPPEGRPAPKASCVDAWGLD